MKFHITIPLFVWIFLGLFGSLSSAQAAGQCCRVNNVHPEYTCSNLTALGEGRCNAVWSGGVPGAGPCQWTAAATCPRVTAPRPQCCIRVNDTHPEFNCGYWTTYGNPVGKNRCNAAWSGGVPGTGPCQWVAGRRCLSRPSGLDLLPFLEESEEDL